MTGSLGDPGSPCFSVSLHLGCFVFPRYPFGVSSVLFGALFSFCGCPLSVLRYFGLLSCAFGTCLVVFSSMCIKSHSS